MKLLALAFAMSAGLAHADLYRWVDRETGSVKFSSYPPPWFGDPERERGAPTVEVIRERAPAPAARPAKPAADKPAPAATAPGLEVQWRGLVQYFASEQASRDLDLSAVTFLQQVELYQAVSRELDRQDPAGAARRHAVAEKAGVADTLRKGLAVQPRTKPAAQ
jgi:hypothetical protein